MTTISSTVVLAVAALAATPAFAQHGAKGDFDDQTKEGIYGWMQSIAEQVEVLRSRNANPREVDRLLAQYDALSARLGGDDPARLRAPSVTPPAAPGSSSLAARAAGASCATSSPTTTSFSGSTGAISDGPTPAYFTASVSTADTYTWDVNVNTSITHTNCSDIDMTLTSPAGTVVTLTTDNAAALDNVYNGTAWDDNVNDPATDRVYVNNVVATPLSPEGRLQAFRGEDPNGTWTLTIIDDAAGSGGGTLSAFSLDVSTLSSSPTLTTTTFSDTPALAIPSSGTVTDTMAVSGLDTYLVKAVLYTEITHTFAADLDMRLISAAGTSVIYSTDNGSGNDNVYNGTTWDPDAPTPVTDAGYANLVVTTPVSPEGSFDNFLGQDPNGTWSLVITDDAAGDSGNLARWDLSLTTTTPPPSASPATNYAGTTGAFVDPVSPSPPLVATAIVGGVGSYAWDVDLTAAITHTAPADLDITLTSPAGTTVKITTDNGGLNDHVFNGTLFDAQTNDPVTNHVFTNNVVASLLSPEGSLDAFRGEDPNGAWTLTVDDDFAGDAGSLNSWTLDVTTYTSAPGETATTISQSPGLAVLDLGTVTDTMVVTTAGQVTKVVLYTEITHTWNEDLDIYLASPAGTVVAVTTDNGGSNDNVFNGTTWDPDGTDAVTDRVFANLVVATPLTPEGSFGNFTGENANGSWSLVITDDTAADVGTLVRWDLTVTACLGPTVFCAPTGPTAGGCLPLMTAAVQPDPTHTSGCTITITGVDGDREAIIYYGISGPNNKPWCGPGLGNSQRCVRGPIARTGAQNSGGTPGACDGSLFLDWDSFQTSNVGALGQPFATGDMAWAQGWFRSPADCMTSFMTEAVELTYQ